MAAICHGPWTLVEADVVRGRTLTSWPSIQTDIKNAGGSWVDEEVHVDQGLVTSRKPGRPAGVLRQAGRGGLRGRARRPAPERRPASSLPAAILDIDGTLVDTNYHHAIAWYRAFRAHGVVLPLWRIHRHIGMGGDQLVAALAGEEFDARAGRRRARRREAALHGADRRGRAARRRPRAARRRSSAAGTRSCSPPRPSRTRSITTSTCSTRANWPTDWTTLGRRGGDQARARPGRGRDREGGRRPGRDGRRLDVGLPRPPSALDVPTIGVLTGGFSELELREAGAACVFENLHDLLANLDDTPLRVACVYVRSLTGTAGAVSFALPGM